MVTRLVALKLTATEHKALTQLVAFGRFPTMSAALREGLMLLLDAAKLKFESRLAIRQERLQHRMRKPRRDRDGSCEVKES